MIIQKTKVARQVKRLKVNQAVNQVRKQQKIPIKRPKLVKMIMLKMKVNHQRREPEVDQFENQVKPTKIPIKKLRMVSTNENPRIEIDR